MEKFSQFVVDVVKSKGAIDAEALLKACTTETPNCPKVLKTATFDEFFIFLQKETKSFFLHGNLVCLSQEEKKFKEQLLLAMKTDKNILSMDVIQQTLKKCGHGTTMYLQANGFEKGVKDFFARNSDAFIFRDNEVQLLSHSRRTEDKKAVEYFLKVLTEKNALTISKLSGHLNQAPEEVKKIVKSTHPETFKDFLLRNSFYFEVNGDLISKRGNSNASDEIFCDIEGDEYEKKAANFFALKLHRKGAQSLEQLVSILNHCSDPEILGAVVSKKLLDIHIFLKKYPNVFRIDVNDKVTLLTQDQQKNSSASSQNYLISSPPSKSAQSGESGDLNVRDGYFSDENNRKSKQIFTQLFGEIMFKNLNAVLLSINVKNLSKVEMLWFDVGKRPMVKVLTNNTKVKYEVHELKNLPIIVVKDLQDWLGYRVLLSLSKNSYGISGYLHTLRVTWLGNSPNGITFFHNTHWPETDNKFEELEFFNLRAILYNPEASTSNLYCSFLRNISRNLAQHHHVIVVDFNGKITGYDSTLPEEVGNARRIVCLSFDDRCIKLMEAFSHCPDYIVTNCLDIVDIQTMKTIALICAQGVKVVCAVHHECKKILNEVEMKAP